VSVVVDDNFFILFSTLYIYATQAQNIQYIPCLPYTETIILEKLLLIYQIGREYYLIRTIRRYPM